jgi:hypothetical protein
MLSMWLTYAADGDGIGAFKRFTGFEDSRWFAVHCIPVVPDVFHPRSGYRLAASGGAVSR